MDKCQQVRAMLADYRTDILSAQERKLVESHLAECESCAEELRVLDDVLALVSDNLVESEPPAGLWNGVANRIASTEIAKRPIFGVWRPLRLAGLGAAALVFAFAIWIGGSHQDTFAPVKTAQGNEYIQGHALYAGQAPLADRVSYLSLVASNEPQTK